MKTDFGDWKNTGFNHENLLNFDCLTNQNASKKEKDAASKHKVLIKNILPEIQRCSLKVLNTLNAKLACFRSYKIKFISIQQII